MLENVVDKEYLKNVTEYFDKNLPEKIYDAHSHISRARMERIGYDGAPIDEFRNFFESTMPRKLDGCLLMAAMSVPSDKVYDENLYIASVARENGFKTGMTVTPTCKRDVVEKMLKENSEIALFKPYLTYAPDFANRYETDMLDFAPEWIWEMANDHDHGASFGRIVSYGSNFFAIHSAQTFRNDNYPTSYGQQSDYKYQPLTNTHEGTLCLLEAIEVLGLSEKDKENIFYNNAYELFKG